MIFAIGNAVREHGVDRATASNLKQLDDTAEASVSKSFAMFLFNSGACDFVQTQSAFNRRPDWRAA